MWLVFPIVVLFAIAWAEWGSREWVADNVLLLVVAMVICLVMIVLLSIKQAIDGER